MSDAYKTITKEAVGIFKDRGSKFYGYVFPMEVVDQLGLRIEALKKEYPKARHFCYAYRLRSGESRSSDDGEPSGSAGKPMMNQLLSKELVDIGAVVVRIFGGTKLGVPGLINAYKQGTLLGIEEAEVVTLYETVKIKVSFDYAMMGKLMDCLKYLELLITQKNLDATPSLLLQVNESDAEDTVRKIKARLLSRDLADISEDTKVTGITMAILPS